MPWVCFLIATATNFLRPGELFPAIEDVPIYDTLMLISLVGALDPLQRLFNPRQLAREPITICVIGLLIAVALSHMTHGSVGATIESVIYFVKTVLYFLFLVLYVDTTKRLWQLLMTVTVSGCLMVGLCTADYLELVDFEFVEHLTMAEDIDEETEGKELFLRMRGTGIFQDPNDISLVIVSMGVLCCYYLSDRGQGPLRYFWVIPLAGLVLALSCTHSRGGLLSALVAGLVVLSARYGKIVAITALLCGVVALPVVAGRQGKISVEEGTAQERVQMWAEGLAELRSPQVFFGIGMGMYSDIAGLVAHNSFVHTFVELGVFGGTLFFGCFFFGALGIYRISKSRMRTDAYVGPDESAGMGQGAHAGGGLGAGGTARDRRRDELQRERDSRLSTLPSSDVPTTPTGKGQLGAGYASGSGTGRSSGSGFSLGARGKDSTPLSRETPPSLKETLRGPRGAQGPRIRVLPRPEKLRGVGQSWDERFARNNSWIYSLLRGLTGRARPMGGREGDSLYDTGGAPSELHRLGGFIAALLGTWASGLFSLSRCYVVPTYLVFGIVAVYVRITGKVSSPPRDFVVWDQPHVAKLIAASAMLLIGLQIFVRVFARWG